MDRRKTHQKRIRIPLQTASAYCDECFELARMKMGLCRSRPDYRGMASDLYWQTRDLAGSVGSPALPLIFRWGIFTKHITFSSLQNIMKTRLFTLTLTFVVMAGCNSDRSALLSRADLVGDYTYHSVDTSFDRATNHELDHLTLQVDGRYRWAQGGSTKVRTEKMGLWIFYPGERPSLSLDNAGFPVQMKKQELRLLVDDDLGEWYVKSR